MHSKLIKLLPVHLGIVSMIVSNWRIGSITFADILITLGLLLLLPKIHKISKNQFIILASTLLILFANLAIHISIGGDITLVNVARVCKVLVLATFIILLYNHVTTNRLVSSTIKSLVGWAVAMAIFGFYIMLAISINAPYEFLWTFTRQDIISYMYRGMEGVIRARSLFSEPQYYGLFLNITLIVALFSKSEYKPKPVSIVIIIIAALSTLSFSTIPVTILITVIFLYLNYKSSILKSWITWATIIALVIAIALMWDQVNTTIIQRAVNILSGKDGSATLRLIESWSHIPYDHIFIGNGIGNTPAIWNNYSYVLSDLGIIPFILMLFFSLYLIKRSPTIGTAFILFSFQKGGYITSYYWMMILLLVLALYEAHDIKTDNNKSKILDENK